MPNESQNQLVNVVYFSQKSDFNDKLMVVKKDSLTGEKSFDIIDDPEITFYINKDEYWTDKPVTYIEPHKVEQVTMKYRWLLKDLANQLGKESVAFFNECRQSGKMYFAKRLHLNANVHGSDVDITDFTIGKFIDENPQPEAPQLTKGYFDIEVDIYNHDGFPDEHEAPCPINIITYFHAPNMTVYTSVLRDPNNPSVGQFEEELGDFMYNELFPFVKEYFGFEVCAEIMFFDTEEEVIAYFYDNVNDLKPDFAGAWNMKFDKLTIQNRLLKLGFDPADFICPAEMPHKMYYYSEDTRNQNFADKNDSFMAASFTNWVDLMLQYASLRKTSGQKESYALNAIAEEELKKRKLEFAPGETIKNLPWINFRKFALYNIVDVILLHALEEKVQDIDMMYSLAIMTRTRISKAMKKTTCLKNLASKFYRDQGYIMSNNHNASYGAERESTEKFRGALVA